MLHGVVDRLGADHAEPAHPVRIVIGHQLLAPHGMDQRRLQPVRQGAQHISGIAAAGAAHDDDAVGAVDPLGDLGDVACGSGKFRSRPKRRKARHDALGLRREHVLRQRQMRDARAGIGRRDRLMNDGRRLRRGRDGFGVERHVAEQQIGLGGLDKISAMHLARHVAGQRQHRRVVAACLVKPRDQMIAAGAGGAGTNRKPPGQFCLAGGGEGRAFFVADADPFDLAAPHRIGQRIEGIADQSEDLLDADLFEHANQLPCDRLCHCPLLMAPARNPGKQTLAAVNAH